jgi:Na+/H+-dicarboxylate symporter
MMRTGIGVLLSLALYALSVIAALFGLLIVYMLIVSFLGRRNPLRFLGHIRDAQLLAFSTGSSAATMPVSMRVAEENVGIRPSTSQLVIPMGATVNMGGTACFHGVATLFMAQLFGIDLAGSALLALITTSLGSSIGAPATPGVGIAILATVLTSVGIPLAGVALIMGIDQILERFRCVLNITGDLVACTVMDRFVEAPRTIEQEHRDQAELAAADVDVATT